jgi:hypothetical protein
MGNTYTGVLTKEYKPKIETLVDDFKARKDPNFFWPTGTQVYVGRQGSGKTISAVKHLIDLKKRYPKAKVVSNLTLTGFKPKTFLNNNQLSLVDQNIDPQKEYIYFSTMEQLSLALTNVNNGFFGVIYIIDEIHTYFNALDSKNIPMFVFTEISQQRKQRKLIIGTSQLFLRMAKPLREQCDNLIVCSTKFSFFTTQKAYDGMTLTQDYAGALVGDMRKTGFFFQTRKLRNAFDTYQKVVSGSEQYEEFQRIDLIGKNGKPIKM